jgi:hypothetical protein
VEISDIKLNWNKNRQVLASLFSNGINYYI